MTLTKTFCIAGLEFGWRWARTRLVFGGRLECLNDGPPAARVLTPSRTNLQQNEAWATSQLILFAPDAPLEPKLFAAQTFRNKVRLASVHSNRGGQETDLARDAPTQQITYDLEQLPAEQLLPLRDSLLSALRTFANGPRVILTQICIALADIALQLTPAQWNDPVAAMIDQFGKEPHMAAALLEFLQVLAEEYNSNFKIKVANDFGREGDASVRRGEQVIGLLSMYVQAQGACACSELTTRCAHLKADTR